MAPEGDAARAVNRTRYGLERSVHDADGVSRTGAMTTDPGSAPEETSEASLGAVLARHHRQFLAFLTSRVASQVVAKISCRRRT
jgi:hypothetical protein